MRRRLIQLMALITLLLCGSDALAQSGEVSVLAGVDRERVVVGDTIEYSIRVEGARSAFVPDLGDFDGASVSFLGGRDESVSSVMIINGKRTETNRESYVMRWRITPTRQGTLRIPVIDVRVENDSFKTRAVIVRVGAPEQTDDMTLEIRSARERVYVGEAVEVIITWRTLLQPRTADFAELSEDKSRVRWFDAPAGQSGQKFELPLFGETVEATQRRVQTAQGSALEFEIRRFIVPQETGKITIGPLSVRSQLIVRRARSVFDRNQERRAGAVSDAVSLDVLPLPTSGRPKGFTSGPVLVGRFDVASTASRKRVRMGDPLTLKVRVTGPMASRVANFKLWEMPRFADHFRVSEEVERRELDDGSVEMTYNLRVADDSVTEIPPVELLCFDTKSERFRAVSSEPIPLRVESTRVVTAEDGFGAGAVTDSGSELEDAGGGVRFNYSIEKVARPMGFSVTSAMANPVWIGAAAAPPTAFAGALLLVGARRARERRGSRGASARRALGEAKQAINRAQHADEIASGMRAYMRQRFEIGGEVTPDAVERVAPGGAGDEVRGVIERCDAARFGGGESDVASLRSQAIAALEHIERAARGGPDA